MRKKDTATCKKMVREYKDKAYFYKGESENLKLQLEDIKVTLSLNKDLINNYVYQSISNDEGSVFIENRHVINELKEENTRLSEQLDHLFDDKSSVEKKLHRVQEEIESRAQKDNETFNKVTEEATMLNNKIIEKSNAFENVKREVEKVISMKEINFSKDLYVINPTKINTELNTELYYTKELISKLAKVVEEDKSQNEKMESEIKQLYKELKDLKRAKGITINTNDKEKIEVIAVKKAESSDSDNDENSSGSDYKIEEENEDDINDDMFFNNFTQEDKFKINKNPTLDNFNLKRLKTTQDHIKDTSDDLESPQVIFPDKVQMKHTTLVKIHGKNSFPPKLDFNIIKGKYVPITNKVFPQKVFQIKKSNTFNSINANNLLSLPKFTKQLSINKSGDEKEVQSKIEQMRVEIKYANDTIIELKAKLEEYKKNYKKGKAKSSKIKENVKLANSKIEMLEKQIECCASDEEEDSATDSYDSSGLDSGKS